jgi:asparagine synthetase B (glutamine-hydrolysing)
MCRLAHAGGASRLAPGHWLDWRSGEITSAAYWQLVFDHRNLTVEAAKEKLAGLLRDSCASTWWPTCLGRLTSGGIDSSTILHYAAGALRFR